MHKSISLLIVALCAVSFVKSQEVISKVKFPNKRVEKADHRLRLSNSLSDNEQEKVFLINKFGRKINSIPSIFFKEVQTSDLKNLSGTYYYLKYNGSLLEEVDRLVISEGGTL